MPYPGATVSFEALFIVHPWAVRQTLQGIVHLIGLSKLRMAGMGYGNPLGTAPNHLPSGYLT